MFSQFFLFCWTVISMRSPLRRCTWKWDTQIHLAWSGKLSYFSSNEWAEITLCTSDFHSGPYLTHHKGYGMFRFDVPEWVQKAKGKFPDLILVFMKLLNVYGVMLVDQKRGYWILIEVLIFFYYIFIVCFWGQLLNGWMSCCVCTCVSCYSLVEEGEQISHDNEGFTRQRLQNFFNVGCSLLQAFHRWKITQSWHPGDYSHNWAHTNTKRQKNKTMQHLQTQDMRSWKTSLGKRAWSSPLK